MIQRKLNNCSKCDYSASLKGHLKRHTESLHKGKRYDYTTTATGILKRPIMIVHDNKKPHNGSVFDYCTARRFLLKNTFTQCMKRKSHINIGYMITLVHKISFEKPH